MPSLDPALLTLASYTRNVFRVIVPHKIHPDELTNPAFWAHVAAKLHPTDLIEVVAEDNTYFAELFVVSCARNWAKVSLLRMVELDESEPDEAIAKKEAEYYTDWGGNISKGRIIRVVDKAVIKDGFPSKGEAAKALIEFEKSLTK